jgi:hypothetical protein
MMLDDFDAHEELEDLKAALSPDRYNLSLTGLVLGASSFPLVQYAMLGPKAFTGNAVAGFPFHYWTAFETMQDPTSRQQLTQFEPALFVANLVLLYMLVALLVHLGRHGLRE